MKITNLKHGLPYHLAPNTQLEVERTNLFFNEYGEQSLPVELPDTDRNREMTGYPDLSGHSKKSDASIPVTIEDGGYFMPGRQVILTAQRKHSITSSFYMNEGEFLSRLSSTSLSDVFGDEVIPGIATVQQGINFCRALIAGTNPHYAIFPVLIDSEESYDNGYPKYKFINRFGNQVDNSWEDTVYPSLPSGDFYNATARTEAVGDSTIELSPGYYMSPFIRANYLLERIFRHFGYTVNENFFTRTHPFPDMVFINNCADALVNGTIRISDLLPNCTCSTILDVFRKKFCCEFIPNEIEKTVDIKLFKEIMNEPPQKDLTSYLTSHPIVEYPEKYERLVISSDEQASDGENADTFKSIVEIFAKYKTLNLNPFDGAFYRNGFSYHIFFGAPLVIRMQDRVSTSSLIYDSGGDLKAKEIKVPDVQPEFGRVYASDYKPGAIDSWKDKFLYIGPASFYNSKLVLTSSDGEQSTDKASKDSSIKPMLAFFYRQKNYPRGTISNYAMEWKTVLWASNVYRLFDYTLCYNGVDGLFEKFYRDFDNIHRNSLHKIKSSFLLSDTLKQSLSAHSPVMLSNQIVLINNFKYLLGGKDEPVETELYTTKLHEPINTAEEFTEYVSETGYVWVSKVSTVEVSKNEYQSSPYKDKALETIFPQPATAELAISGKQYYVQRTCVSMQILGINYYLNTVWLECVKE